MDCVMKSRISRWRSVRAPRVSSRTNVNEPMFGLRLCALNRRMVRNRCAVSTKSSGLTGPWSRLRPEIDRRSAVGGAGPPAHAPADAEAGLLANLVEADGADQVQRLRGAQAPRRHLGRRHGPLADPVTVEPEP